MFVVRGLGNTEENSPNRPSPWLTGEGGGCSYASVPTEVFPHWGKQGALPETVFRLAFFTSDVF